MKFYGKGSVWDRANDKILCRFNLDGTLETENQRVSGILMGLGYKHDPIVIPEQKKETKSKRKRK
jgi:hypothetical protein